MRVVVFAILLYLGGGTALMLGIAWWQQAHAPALLTPPPADGSFSYPTVLPPPGRTESAWKSGHLDGWKWCLEHVREGWMAEDGQLAGFLVGEPDRDDGFRLGYASARAHVQVRLSSDGAEAMQRDLVRLRRRQPALYDLTVSAPPP